MTPLHLRWGHHIWMLPMRNVTNVPPRRGDGWRSGDDDDATNASGGGARRTVVWQSIPTQFRPTRPFPIRRRLYSEKWRRLIFSLLRIWRRGDPLHCAAVPRAPQPDLEQTLLQCVDEKFELRCPPGGQSTRPHKADGRKAEVLCCNCSPLFASCECGQDSGTRGRGPCS